MTAAAHNPEHDGLHLSNLIHQLEGAEVLPPRPPDLGKAALWYATKWDWPVFPLQPGGKKPLTTHGLLDATTNADQIRAWWQQWPNANIGIPTGSTGCGHDVIDLDDTLGINSFAASPDTPTPLAITFTPGDPSKNRGPGRHLYVPASGDGNAAGLLPGVDLRGLGGYVVAPPSIGPGGAYAWLQKPEGKP